MNYMIPTSDINGIITLDATFLDLSQAWLTGYSTGDKQGSYKTDDLPQRFVLIHNGKPIAKLLVFRCLTLKFSQLLPLV